MWGVGAAARGKSCLLAHAAPSNHRTDTRANAPTAAAADSFRGLRVCRRRRRRRLLDNQASTKTADIKVQVEGCLTGATTDVTPGGGAKQSVPVLGKCPAGATTTAAPGATTTAAAGAAATTAAAGAAAALVALAATVAL